MCPGSVVIGAFTDVFDGTGTKGGEASLYGAMPTLGIVGVRP